MIGVTSSANTVPSGMPPLEKATERARSFSGIQRAYWANIAGKVTASPMPIRMRTITSTTNPKAAAGGVITVNSDQSRTPKPSTTLPPKRSASLPPMICSSM